MKFLRSFWTKNSKSVSLQETLPANFSEQVQKAIKLLGEEGRLENEDVLTLFTSNGIGKTAAVELLLFLPVAFVRRLLPDLKWHKTYIEYVSDKTQIERTYEETASFQTISEITEHYFQNSPQQDVVLKIAGRSAEFNAINELLKDGGKLEDVEISKTVFIR
jgi:translation initiation factor RLI1